MAISVLDRNEGTAGINDYTIVSGPGIFLASINAYTEIYSIHILDDALAEEDETIKLHFQFKSLEADVLADSIIIVTIQDDDKKWKKDPSNTIKTEFVQFTDFLGFSNDRPNGILQQQFLFKWPIVKSYLIFGKNFAIQPLRSILFPNILFNRIEKSGDNNSLLFPVSTTIRNVDSSGTVTKDTSLSPVISSFDIHRYTAQKLETRLILLALFIGNTRIHIEYIGSIVRNKVLDTITTKQKTERGVYSFSSGWSIYAKSLLDRATKLNIEAEFGYMKFFLKDNFFKQYDVFKLDNEEKRAIAFPIGEKYNRQQNPIYFTRITLSKDWGKDSKNSAFFRLRYNYQTGKFRFYDLGKPGFIKEEKYYNHFLQLQLGISLGLEKLFGG
ncbi:MAG: hypothetical protein JNL23_02305 [Chitinophagaceae bacterium]|nr:hypothetical protein [Chitinophagaceae bacterium]